MYFFKTHHGDVVSPVYRAIAAATKTRPADVFAVWMAHQEFASEGEDRGSVAGLIIGDVAEAFAIDIRHARAIVRELCRRGFIKDGLIADWEERQENPKKDVSVARQRRYRVRQKNKAKSMDGDGDAVTAPSRVTRNGDVESRSIEDSPPTPPQGGAALELVHDADFAALWAIWPKKDGRKPALDRYSAVRKRGVPHADILAGAKRYAAEPRDKKFCKLLAGWLNDERWTDGGATDADNAARDAAAMAATKWAEQLKGAA